MADSIILATARAHDATPWRKMKIIKALAECSTSKRSDEARITKYQETQTFHPFNTDRFLTHRLLVPLLNWWTDSGH
jgi:hypothetical protein